MLQFAKIDAPALPVHDSFIMHHGYGGELEEAMRRAFYDHFRGYHSTKHPILGNLAYHYLDSLKPDVLTDISSCLILQV